MTPDALRSRYGLGPHDLARDPGDLADLVLALRLVARAKTVAIAQAMGTTQRTLCRLRSKVKPSLTTKNERSDHNPNQPMPGIQRPGKRIEMYKKIRPDLSGLRQLYGILHSRAYSASEVAGELCVSVPTATKLIERGRKEGWVIVASAKPTACKGGVCYRYRASHQPEYCKGGFVPPSAAERSIRCKRARVEGAA